MQGKCFWLPKLTSYLSKSDTSITDELICDVFTNLTELAALSLTNCSNVTHTSILFALRHSRRGIESLGLEGVSTRFDWVTFIREDFWRGESAILDDSPAFPNSRSSICIEPILEGVPHHR
ncbi:hypothetical protein FRC15_008183 [Serendipita sp. 397]|nr:hypothetical protein FRC15_008183 [Serendipita sp. 397]